MYDNGYKEGEYKSYHENGKLHEIGTYENRILKGQYRRYSEDGKLECVYSIGKNKKKWNFFCL